MRVKIDMGEKKYEGPLIRALSTGIRRRGDTVSIDDCDVAAVFGVKAHEKFRHYRAEGKPVLVFDKGYVAGRTGHFRVAVNAPQAGRYLMQHQRPGDRWRALAWHHIDRATLPGPGGDAVLLALSSQKYNDWYGLGDALSYADEHVKLLMGLYDKVIYRPKPSWAVKHQPGDLAIYGADLSVNEPLDEVLTQVKLVVTHGSGAAIDAVLSGVPAVTLCMDAAAGPVSGGRCTLDDPTSSYWASVERRTQWAHNLAYTQWSLEEFKDGTAWRHIREDMEVAT